MSTRDIVERLGLRVGQSRRIDCPECGGNNSMSVTRKLTGYVWYCFRDSCKSKGAKASELSADAISQVLRPRTTDTGREFIEPSHWTALVSDERCVRYAQRYGCWKAYNDNLVDMRYDPQKDRVVFMVRNDGRIVDAVGRSLTGQTPKWWRYGATDIPFVCSAGSRTAIVVEDAASACAVTQVGVDGVALLGTRLTNGARKLLQSHYDTAIVALDKDATLTALKVQKEIASRMTARIIMLGTDLKYLGPDEICRVLKVE